MSFKEGGCHVEIRAEQYAKKKNPSVIILTDMRLFLQQFVHLSEKNTKMTSEGHDLDAEAAPKLHSASFLMACCDTLAALSYE